MVGAHTITKALRYPVRLIGTGCHRPERRILSTDLDVEHDRESGTTEARSGVRERRWAGPDETSSSMAVAALRTACDRAGLRPADLDALVVASVMPEQPMPTTAVLVLRELGLGGDVQAFDVNASCLGFLVGLEWAASAVTAGRRDVVAVVATELASKGLDHGDVESSALFGDGAAAALVTRSDVDDLYGVIDTATRSEILALRFETWPEGAELCRIGAGGTRWNTVTSPPDPTDYYFHMNGPGMLRLTERRLPRFFSRVLAEAGTTIEEIDVVIPHQASGVGIRYLCERLRVPDEKVVRILPDHGNQVSASVPTALHEAIASGRLRRGGRAMILGTGAGLTLGAAVLRY